MRKLQILFVLFLYAGIAQAQTEAETLEWLNAKKIDIRAIWSNTMPDANKKYTFDINNDNLYLENVDGASTRISWSSIKDIKPDGDYHINIVSNRMYEGKNSYMLLSFEYNKGTTPKYIKALKHMATLKGAKLVDDDLFGE